MGNVEHARRIKTECSKCGAEITGKRRGKQAYCNPCHAAHMRLTRPAYADLTTLQKKKSNARAYLNTYKRRGKVKAQPCCICNAMGAEAHHSDYGKPLKVEWYCREHHLELHKQGKVA